MKRSHLILFNFLFIIFSSNIVSAENISVFTAGRDYYLYKSCSLGFEYNFEYIKDSYDLIKQRTWVEDVDSHLIVNEISHYYAPSDILNFNLNIPYIYEYHKAETIESKKNDDFGDISTGFKLKIFEENNVAPSIILKGIIKFPTGESPYKIQVGEELSTGSGYFSTMGKISAFKTIYSFKTIFSFSIFCNANYTYNFDVDNINQKRPEGVLEKVEPGNQIGFNVGTVYSLFEKIAFCMEYPYAYNYKTKYQYLNAPTAESDGESSNPVLYIGVGWKYFQENFIKLKAGIPLSSNGPDFQLYGTILLPFPFKLPSVCCF